ncbi:MAG: glycosyltransferase [Bacteroidia bacterium]|nr:glycosyltransferase family 4 protein [Bacteroidia bacterium]NNC86633.1 glycosyltransferase [Bacteroidia bacterium]NNM16464.1 glycosyltransferase [Bacteroidia bacterium]
MRVLQLCLRVPFPPRDGGAIAMYNITKALWSQNVDVDVLSVNTPKHFVDVSAIDNHFVAKTNLETVDINTAVKPVAALSHLIKNQSYQVSRFYCKKFEEKLIEKLQKGNYDVVQLESLFMAPYLQVIREHSKAKIALRAHNVEHIVWHRLYQNEKNPVTKWYLKKLTAQLKQFEIETLQNIDAVVSISQEDLNYFKQVNHNIQSIVFPLSLDLEEYRQQSTVNEEFSVFHLGSMDWFPNIEGVNWFLKNVHSKLINAIPNIQIFLAGKNMPSNILNKKFKNITVEGNIDNPVQYMQGKDIMIVPLFSGSGMRVKIIEGMALGKVVISTSIGAEGINYTDKKNILIANTPDEFVNAINELQKNKNMYHMIAENARQLVSDDYDNIALGHKLNHFYQSLVRLQTATTNTVL